MAQQPGIPVPYLAIVRKRQGLTQADLAQRMKPRPGSVAAISRAENGGLTRPDTIQRWARVLHVKPEELTTPPEERAARPTRPKQTS